MKLSIRRRIFFLVFSSVLVALIASGAVTVYGTYDADNEMRRLNTGIADYMSKSMGNYTEKFAKERLEEVTKAKARHLDRELAAAGDDADHTELYRIVDIASNGTAATSFMLDSTGKLIYFSDFQRLQAFNGDEINLQYDDEPTIVEAVRHMIAGESGVMSVEEDGDIYYLAFAPMPSVGWSLGLVVEDDEVLDPVEEVSAAVRRQMGYYQEILQQAMEASTVRTVAILIPVLLLIFYYSGFMANRVARPIHRLADGVREISAGNFDKKLEIHTGDEIEELAESFNNMTGELKAYMKNLELAAEEQGRANAELEVAARIQEDMLPNIFPAFPNRHDFDIYASMDAAKNVGGDFYDFYLADENHLVIAIADVSGKGVPAALFMAKSQSVLRNCVLKAKSLDDVAGILENANKMLCSRNDAAMFVTVFFGVLELSSGHFVYGDAGHCVPFLGRNGSYEYLPMKKGSMLGLMELPYEQQSIDLLPGDRLFLYTDGVSESMDENEKQFTEPCIRESLNEMEPQQNIKDILLEMSKIIKHHAGKAEQSDDITMLGIEYKGNA